jgi:hypothetical protein
MKTLTTPAFMGLLIALLSLNLLAQTSNATLGGTVADASGALIPGVEVTARNVATGIVNTTITNESGAYQFASLQTGTYQVSATLAGFQTATNNNVTLGGSEQVRLNFVLRVGDIATTGRRDHGCRRRRAYYDVVIDRDRFFPRCKFVSSRPAIGMCLSFCAASEAPGRPKATSTATLQGDESARLL